MFVRWKTRTPRRSWYADFPHRNPGPSYSAVLVRSERVDGKPRQKVVLYLGHIKEKYRHSPARRFYFWERADRLLDSLNLTPAERQKIEEQLSAVVRRAIRDEVAQARQETMERLARAFSRG